MYKRPFPLILIITSLILISACTLSTPTEVAVQPTSQATATVPIPITPQPTDTPIPPTDTPRPTNTPLPTATQTATLIPTATLTSTNTSTPLPTNTPAPTATTTLIPFTPAPTQPSAPTAVPTSSLPGNPLPLTGGVYNGCPFLAPGLYTTAPNCSDCPSMDLAQWTMGTNLLQVTSAYEQNGDIHIILSNGQDINLNAVNFRWLVEMHSVSRAIETREDSITHIAVDPLQMYSIFGPGTWVGSFNTDGGASVLKVTAVCGE